MQEEIIAAACIRDQLQQTCKKLKYGRRDMQNEPCAYRDFFHQGQRASIEMAVEGKVFNVGAIVTAAEETHLALRVFPEQLPEGAGLHREESVLIRVGGSGFGYSCRMVVLEEPPGEEVLATFAGPVVPEDTREYFRLGTEIPVVLFNVTAGTAEENGFGGVRVPGQTPLPRIVNISGGGLRTETEMPMTSGDIVYATFHLPLPEPKVVPVVGQVMHADFVDDGETAIVSAGLSFMHINERDRDAIVRYVCNEEINRIKLSRKEMALLRD